MKIAMLDVHNDNYEHVYNIGSETKKSYCNKHGYDFLEYKTEHLIPRQRQDNWGRVQGIIYHLKNYDWLFYLDTDILIMNHEIKIESFIDENYNLIVGPLPEEGHLMTSGLLIKNCKWSFEFFLDLYAQVQFIDSPYYSPEGFTATGTPNSGGSYFEQSAFHYLFDNYPKYSEKIKVVPRKLFNSEIGKYQEGDFLIHFPGQYAKSKLMKLMLNEGYESVVKQGHNFHEKQKQTIDYSKIKQKKIFTLSKKLP